MPYFNAHYCKGVQREVFILLGKTHIMISVWKYMKLLSICVTFTKLTPLLAATSKKNNKNKKSRPDNAVMGQMPASINAVIMMQFGRQHSSTPAKDSGSC